VTDDYEGARQSQRRATRNEALVVGLFGTVATLAGAGTLALGLLLGPL
jgi:hypothetical protein